MESIMESMKSCTNGTENAQVQIRILTGLFFKKKLCKMQNEGQKEELTYFAASNEWLEKPKQIYGVREKDCVEKLMKFPQQQYKH